MENTRINVKTFARLLKKELPELSLSQLQEMTAKAAGFANFRTLLAMAESQESTQVNLHLARAQAMREAAQTFELYDDATMKNDYMLDASECAGIVQVLAQREENIAVQLQMQALNKLPKDKRKASSNVTQLCVLPMREHELHGFQEEDAQAQYPEHLNARYEATVSLIGDFKDTSSPVVDVKVMPKGFPEESALIGDCLSFFLEINGGVPCLHISNDVLGGIQLSVFATREGLLVRESEGKFIPMNQADYRKSPVLKRVVEENAREYRCEAYVIPNDLAELSESEPLPAPATTVKGSASSSTYVLKSPSSSDWTVFEGLQEATAALKSKEQLGDYSYQIEDNKGLLVMKSEGGWLIRCYKNLHDLEERQFKELAPGHLFRTYEKALTYLQHGTSQAIVEGYSVFKIQTQDGGSSKILHHKDVFKD